jgi:phospholipase D1/2
LGDALNLKALTQVAQRIDVLALAPLAIVPAYVLTAAISVAITLLTTSTGLVFDAAWGSFYALAGRSLRLRSAI